ncbi:membrane protein [Enterococcus saigonensis]|uniref:Membrane protein n=1 Tax=Enterococcus saigonensis TaxID=1805431 RepID=A0A679I828_9ENTE|nr:DUF998 domain-containing protein [Enterococcus saigonensis]BCA84590.1 membrane protein [Enterococcus saigonensis]
MNLYRKYGWLLMLLFVVGDGGMPYFLGILWQEYSQTRQVVSDLGSVSSPVKEYFERGSVLTGILLLLALPAVKFYFNTAQFQSKRREIRLLLTGIAAFAIGDCIFTGIFAINHQTSGFTLATIIHGLGSGAGILGMLAAPFFLARIFAGNYFKIAKGCWFIFYGALATSAFNGLAQLFSFTYKGAVQRISLVFLYMPLLVLVYFFSQKNSK